MDNDDIAKSYKLGDESTSDVTIHLKNKVGRNEIFCAHSVILKAKSKYFAERLSHQKPTSNIEIHCSDLDYEYHIDLLKRLYLSEDSLLDSYESVKTTVGILQVASTLCCEEVISSCIKYLEAVPWEDKEEEGILKVVSKLGPIAMPILARIQPVDSFASKNVFLSAIRFATSITSPCPPFGDELKISAQEQVQYMLGEDEDAPLVIADEEVKAEVRLGLLKIRLAFEKDLSLLILESDLVSDKLEDKIMQSLSDLEWICSTLPKMELMKDFVASWDEMSENILSIVESEKIALLMWGFKLKLIEITLKVLEAVGYGNVIIQAPCRVHLLKMWLPFIRKMKPLLDSMHSEDCNFPHKMDEELCQGIEGAIVSIVSALPSHDQADILSDWMRGEQMKYPDLSEAFEVWCYRTKSAKRRLLEGSDLVGEANTTLGLDLSH